MQIELSKKSAKLIDDYINGRQELSDPIYQKLRKQLNLCIEELENLVWYRTCDPSQYDKLAKRLKDYEKMEKEMIKVFRFYKELNGDNNRKEFYRVGTQDEEEQPVMKMKLIRVTCKDARPQIRIKVAGNVFMEVYKDNKGYFYRIDIPGQTDFVSKERFESQDKAKAAGQVHAKKFITKVKAM